MNMRNLMIVASAAAPVFVTGTQNLMNDAMTWVLVLIPTAAALYCAWKAFCYQSADENERTIGHTSALMESCTKKKFSLITKKLVDS